MPGFAELAGAVLKGSADATNRRNQAEDANRRNTFSVFLGNRVNGIPGPDNSANTLLQGIAGAINSNNQADQQAFNRERSLRALALLGGNASAPVAPASQTVPAPQANSQFFGPPASAQNSGFGFLSASQGAQVDPRLQGRFTQF